MARQEPMRLTSSTDIRYGGHFRGLIDVDNDRLSAQRYVESPFALLRDQYQGAPLNIGIAGAWDSHNSSLLRRPSAPMHASITQPQHREGAVGRTTPLG